MHEQIASSWRNFDKNIIDNEDYPNIGFIVLDYNPVFNHLNKSD